MSWRALVERRDVVESTMLVARSRAGEGAQSGTTIVAAAQSAGRGRLGRAWFAEPGHALLLTTILRPPAGRVPSPLSLAGLVAGVGVRSGLERAFGVSAALKWPNDVVVGERKLAGILIEGEHIERPEPLLLLGVGVNLAPRASLPATAPADVRERYIGLCDVTARPLHTELVDEALAAVLDGLELVYERWLAEGGAPILEAFAAADALYGREVRVEAHGSVTGLAEGVDASGALCVRTARGVALVNAGEVTRVRPAG